MKKLLLLFALLLLVVAIYQWGVPTWLPESDLVRMVELDTSRVTALVIRPEKEAPLEYTFKREQNGWIATDQRVARPAPSGVMDSMLMVLGRIHTRTLLPASHIQDPTDYRWEKGVEFVLFEGDQIADAFTIHRFIHLEKGDTLYQIAFARQPEPFFLPEFDLDAAWPGFYRFHDPRLWKDHPDKALVKTAWLGPDSTPCFVRKDREIFTTHRGDTLDPDRAQGVFEFLMSREVASRRRTATSGAWLEAKSLSLYFGEAEADSVVLQLKQDTLDQDHWGLFSSKRSEKLFLCDSVEFYTTFINPLERLVFSQPAPDTLRVAN